DAAPEGIRAAFLLLEGLGFDVKVSRRVAQGQARWVLFPRLERDNMSVLDAWVRDGGRLLLADEDVKAADALGVPVGRAWKEDQIKEVQIDGAALRWTGGKVQLTPRAMPERTWPPESPRPVAGIFNHGRGEVWLVYRPDFLHNDRLRNADNALLLCRLAEA